MEIIKYINWQQFTKGMHGKLNEQLFPRQVVIQLPKLNYVTHIIGEPKYKYGQQEQVTVSNHKYRVGTCFVISCIPDKLFRDFHQCWQILYYIPIFDPWDRKNSKNNMCCQYIGCIGGHVNSVVKTLGVDFITMSHDINFQYGGHQHIRMLLVNGDFYVKIKCYRSKGMQEKDSIMVVWCG